MLKLVQPSTAEQYALARELFVEYGASLGFDLCFQDFDEELAALPGDYAPPDGCILLAYLDGRLAGCVGLRKIEREICEMKRLYVRPAFRGRRIGLALVGQVIEVARNCGYRRMRLDTVPSMEKAIEIYTRLGFVEIDPYRVNPIPGAKYMELELKIKERK